MIIQFAVENYRSIKDEQVLSLVKSTGDEMPDNYFQSSAPKTPQLLKSAVIYGANASGKSNVVKGLASMISIIKHSFKKDEEDNIDTETFLFDVLSNNSQSIYDISFILPLENNQGELQEIRVDYGFVVDKYKVYEEWLSIYPDGEQKDLFHREYREENQDYHWVVSECLIGETESWKNQTRSDQLFLSSAVHLNSTQLKPIYHFLSQDIIIVRTDRISTELSKSICKSSEVQKNIIISLLKSADIEVEDIVFERPVLNFEDLPKELPEVIKNNILKDLEKAHETFFVYLDNLGHRQKINLHHESDGTQKLFEFAGLILAVLESGDTLVIDELNKSLHPALVCFLVKLFNSEHNKNNAQLIFTTHETSVLRKDLLRRDQIWFCEKGRDRTTRLYSLSDFKESEKEDVEGYYLDGLYGAVPIITTFNFPSHLMESE